MASIEELEEAVKKLEAQLEKESSKTAAVEKELQSLQDEVSEIKKKMNDNDASTTKEEKPKTEKTIEKSPSQSDKKEKSARREKSEKNLKESKSEDKEPVSEEKKEGEVKKEKREKKEKKEKKNESESDFKMKMNENDKESKSMNIESNELSKSESQEKLKEKSEEKEAPIKPSGSSSTEEGPAIVKSGYLEKKGAIRHNWLKRWFVLDAHERKLSYYDKKDAKDDAKGVVPLINATCYAHVEKKGVVKPLFFNVRTENRDFLIKAESKEDKDEWVKAIRAVCVKGEMPSDLKKHLNRSGNSFIGRTSEEVEAKKTPLPLGN